VVDTGKLEDECKSFAKEKVCSELWEVCDKDVCLEIFEEVFNIAVRKPAEST
jgi:hypothetical protein